MSKRELLNEALKQAIEIRDGDLILALFKKGAKVDIDSFDYIPGLMKTVEALMSIELPAGVEIEIKA